MGNPKFGRPLFFFVLLILLFPSGPLVGSDRVMLSTVYEIKGPPGGAFGNLADIVNFADYSINWGRCGTFLDVALNERREVFVLDKLKNAIHRFGADGKFLSSIDIPVVAGAESGILQSVNVSRNRLYVLKGRNILVLDLDRGSGSRIPLNELVSDAFYVHHGAVVVSGTRPGSEGPFHILDDSGNEIVSFGTTFAVPNYILRRLPRGYDPKDLSRQQKLYYSAPDDEIYAINPFRYEIEVYKSRKLFRTLRRDIPYYEGVTGSIGRGPRTPREIYSAFTLGPLAPSVIKRGDTILVFRPKGTGGSYCVDIFKDYGYLATQDLDIKGLPIASDQEGNVYAIKLEDAGSVIKMKLDLN